MKSLFTTSFLGVIDHINNEFQIFMSYTTGYAIFFQFRSNTDTVPFWPQEKLTIVIDIF